jgi:two-component system cell cycle sensor histidine kinase/response regulator CckA
MTTGCILVVEDEAVVAMDLQHRLRKQGYDVPVTVATGEHAIAEARRLQPQLILMDVRLKGEMDGIEAALQIRRTSDIPIIFLTAYADSNTVDRAKITEPFGYILKPFEERDLHTAIEVAIYKHRVESELRRNRRWLAATLRAISDAVIAVNGESEVVFMNPVAEVLTGYAQKDAAGKRVGDVFRTTFPSFGEALATLFGAGGADSVPIMLDVETTLIARDGKRLHIEERAAPIRDENGTIAGAVLVFRDITDLKRTQEEHLAKQKLESVGTLAGGIAHDFNNLLGAVLAQSELALAELRSGARPEEELQRIRTAAIRGAEIVRQLMIYAGKESDTSDLVDVSRIVEEMLELLTVSVTKHAAVETDLGKNLPAVRANPSQLRQVVMNLVTNASEAIGDRDGVIRVTTERVASSRDLPIYTSKRLAEGDYVQLEVSDTGCGMTTDTKARIFDPFFTTKPAGHGLGLAVVQGIVRNLGGTVGFLSAKGKGTTFQILLPSAEPAPQATHSTVSRAGEGPLRLREATILVVEDEELLRIAASKVLRKTGLSVIEASDGSAALDLIREHKDHIDVLLLDVTLPGASSRDVFEEVKRLRPDVRVVVTSAYSEETAVASLGGSGARFIRKPYRLDQLTELIWEVLSS